MGKTVSVLIPTYRSDYTLTRAIDSVLSQTYPDYEVVVVDDNPPDDEYRAKTIHVMEKYKGHPRVKYIQHDRNRNGAAARNTAFAASKGEYIAFLDDDDYYDADKLRIQVEYMESHPGLMGCYCWRRQGGKEICGRYSGNLSEVILSLEFTPTTCALMLRREAMEELHGFDESYRRHQDFEFLLRYFQKYTLDYVPSIQLELSTNGVNNVPKGKNLVELKEHFFTEFAEQIDSIYTADRKTGEKIYRNHFVDTFKDLIRDREFRLALYIYKKYHKKWGKGFWRLFFKKIMKGRFMRISKVISHSKGKADGNENR